MKNRGIPFLKTLNLYKGYELSHKMTKCNVMLTLDLTKLKYIAQKVIYQISRLRFCQVLGNLADFT